MRTWTATEQNRNTTTRIQVHHMLHAVSDALFSFSPLSSIRSSLFATSSGRNNASSSSSSYGRPSASQSSFGGRPSGSSDLNDRIYAEQSERMLESQNDALANRLSEKVNLLKQISIDFGVEVKEQNAMLADMVRKKKGMGWGRRGANEYVVRANNGRNRCALSDCVTLCDTAALGR